MHQKLLENVQGVFLRQVFRVRFVCLNAGSGRITCSGYPGRRPPSPPPSSCSSPWPPTGRLKHTKHAKLKSNLIAKSQKYKKKRKTNLRSICKMKRGRNQDIYLKGTCYVIYLFHYFDSFSVRACGRKLRLVFTKKLGLIKKMVQPKCLLTFEPVNLLLQLGHRPLGELSTSLSLVGNSVTNYHYKDSSAELTKTGGNRVSFLHHWQQD